MSQIKYLLIIYELTASGEVRSNDIAKKMNISRTSVHKMLNKLAREKLIAKEKYSSLTLLDEGIKKAECLYEKYVQISQYFNHVMCLSEDIAAKSAFALIGALDEDAVTQICKAFKQH